MSHLIQLITIWISGHPQVAGLAVLLISFSESLAGIGLLVPGAALMLAAGALIAAGALAFWPTMGWAVLGAVLADGLSYWLGRHYREDIRSFRIFARHQAVLARGEAFFQAHGGKSVFFGRFVGPLRPVIPLVAGMLAMKPERFFLYNVLSALGWAPAYLLPGMAFGASLALAGEVAGRLAILLALVLFGGWAVFFLSRRIVGLAVRRFPAWEQGLRTVLRRSPLRRQWLGGLLDPDQPLFRPLLLLSLLFVGAAWIFLGITEDVVTGDPLVRLDHSVYHLLQGLRSPWGDVIMIGLTMLGDAAVTMPLALAAVAWLFWRRDRYSGLFLAGTVAGGLLLVTVVKNLTRIPRPVDMYGGAVHWAFPSSHAAMSVVVFGFLAMLCCRELSARRRWLPVALAVFLMTAIGASRLYLGAHWFSDVAGGYSLGTAWLVLLLIAYFHHAPSCSFRGLSVLCLTVFLLAAGLHWSMSFAGSRQRYALRYQEKTMAAATWLAGEWRRLPAARQDLEGEPEQPLNVQYAGDLAWLRKQLRTKGWLRPVGLTPMTALHWLLAEPEPRQLPILPQVHDGRHEKLLLIHSRPAGREGFLALRLWPTGIRLDGAAPLWVGTLTRMSVHRYLGLVNLPRTRQVVSPAGLAAGLPVERKVVRRPDGRPVLLLRQTGR
ncbi:MAG: phosphatase PAP2 family protein [Deltaproteobacteria bacterium]|nr:phosphatase PAP2 family protein [Deltaproteobacteria bacterium]